MYSLLTSHVNDDRHLRVGSMNYTTRHAGTSGGLMLALYVNQRDYLYANSPSAGFRVSSVASMFKCNYYCIPGNMRFTQWRRQLWALGHVPLPPRLTTISF